MDSDLEAIRRVVEAFERSDWDEIDVRSGSLRVHLVAASAASAPTSPSPGAGSDSPAPAEDPPSDTDRPADRVDGPVAPPVPAGAHIVTSPSPGTFWRAPEPGAPPFTEVGRGVEPEATVCIVEVMKLMNHVKAGVGGRVVAIYAENGAAIGKDDPLFALAPSEGSSS